MSSKKDDAIVSAYAILSLLHYRGLNNSTMNREDIAKALTKLRPFAKEAEDRMMRRHEARERNP
jgi:hypothetical protein